MSEGGHPTKPLFGKPDRWFVCPSPNFRDNRFEEIFTFDIEDFEATTAALRGVEAVIHLAANPDPLAPFHDLFGPNVIGAYNLLEASRQAGCRRVIFASSVHVIMGYPKDYQAHNSDPPRPDCVYGATKLFGEALCAVFARQFGLSCIAIRIGAHAPEGELERMVAADPDAMSMAVTQRDLGQLIHKCVIAPAGLSYAVLHGVSNNRYKRMDIEQARDLVDYRPIDDAFDTPRNSSPPNHPGV